MKVWMGNKRALAFAATALLGASCVSTHDVRTQLMEVPVSAALGGETTRPLATSEAFTFVAANAPDSIRTAFSAGNVVFNRRWAPVGEAAEDSDGLGPVFNRQGCGDCHVNNGRGRAPAGPNDILESALVRLSIPAAAEPDIGPQGVHGYGTQLQDRAIFGVQPEARIRLRWQKSRHQFKDGTPYELRRPLIEVVDAGLGPLPDETMYSLRVASQLIGLGLLERIPTATLEAHADPADSNRDGISGRINRVFSHRDNRMAAGRFGWKANSTDLASQNATAALDDVGITSTLLPRQNCEPTQSTCRSAPSHNGVELSDEALKELTIYTQWIAVPRQRNRNRPNVRRGFEAFVTMGCGSCHVPTLITARDDTQPALSEQLVHPFTDLLLHDMGEGLADGRPDFLADGREWRTPPLWGIGLTQQVSGHTEFLHDGRARSLQEAILWHGGEAELAREKFRSSNADQRAQLLDFLNSL